MFLSEVVMALAATGCSPSEPVPSDRRSGSAAAVPAPVSQTGPRLKLTAGKNHGVLCYADWVVAREKGFFSAEGLDVEFLDQDTSRPHGHGFTSAWLTGPTGPVRTDLMPVEYPALADMASDQMDYYVVAGEHSGCRQIVCPVDAPIRTLADLRGKRIGMRPVEDSLIWEFLIGPTRAGTEPTQWIRGPFNTGDPKELEWVKQEFAAGRIDAYIGGDPTPEILKADGVAKLVASNTWTPPLNGWYCCMLAARKELVDAHPDLPRSFTRAIRRAASFVEENPAEAVALAVAKGYLPRDTRQDLCARLLGEYVWTATGRIQEDLERYFQLLIDAGRMPATTPPRELVNRVYRSGD
jgi:ABC-type nitrate/sulfonate/bicarbonate transport system substrate-binding protein